MRIDEVIWETQFVEKLVQKHNVIPSEVEEVLSNQPYFRFATKGNRTGEDVYSAMGQTNGGRYLLVFFILKNNHKALVISARDMDKKERRYYGSKR